MWVLKTPQVATVQDAIKESGRVLPHPNAHLPHDISTGIRGWPMHYPDVHPGDVVGYHPTRQPSKLLSLWDPINPVWPVHNQCLFLRAQPTQSLIDTGRGYHLRSSEHENKPHSNFPSGILHFPLVDMPGLILCHIPKVKTIIHIGPPSRERALSWAISNHSSSTDSLHN
jgi:hypothetical protein